MNKQALTDSDRSMILKFLLGGAALGGGTALGTTFMAHINQMRRKAAEEQNTVPDDTLVLRLKAKQPPEETTKVAMMANGLAIAGGAVSSVVAYKLVRDIAAKLRQKQLQAELDAAQDKYLQVVQTEADANKVASTRGFSTSDTLLGLPVAAGVLLALGTGVLTKKYLDKAFPAMRPDVAVNPKRVILRTGNTDDKDYELAQVADDEDARKSTEDAEPELTVDKVASSDDADEMLLRIAAVMDKHGSNIGLADMVAATAQGRFEELMSNVGVHGAAAIDLVKGAASNDVRDLDWDLAVSLLVKDAGAREIAMPLAAAVFAEHAPFFVRKAAAIDPVSKSALVKLAADTTIRYRASVFGDALPECAAPTEDAAPLPGQMSRVLTALLQKS